jgi:prepilin-type N-terminal cleavage/methylation domain-containing protein
MKKIIAQSKGFTLIEVMIAIGILAIGIGAIIVAENNSLDVTIRAKRMTTVATLAKNTLIQAEREIEGKDFLEVKDDSTGKFESPYADYSWERKIKEITFPNLLDPNIGGAGGAEAAKKASTEATTSDPNTDRVVKLATNFLSKATREITVTIKWKEKGEDQNFSVSQYWVDLKHEFKMTDE